MKPDSLQLHSLREDPQLYEDVVLELHQSTDPSILRLLQDTYYEADRARAFQRYLDSPDFAGVLRILRLSGISRDEPIVEVGGGPGFLSYALARSGYPIELVEPNGNFVTGTGYLETLDDVRVRIWNDLDAWYGSETRYTAILTHNCVHHFRPVNHVAACLRQKLRSSGKWLMLHEWFAESPEETYRRLAEHPWSQSHGLFEFPYPAEQLVRALEQVGFTFRLAVPNAYVKRGRGVKSRALHQLAVRLVERSPRASRAAFWAGAMAARRGITKGQFLARPPALLFERSRLSNE